MASSLDMSLDDRIKNRGSRQRGRGRGRARPGNGQGGTHGGRMSSTAHRGSLAFNARPSSHAIIKASLNNVDAYTCD